MLAVKPDLSTKDCETLFATLKGERHIALAVSGGSDSMAMLRLALQWSKSSTKLTVLTVDHGLRPEAAGEARQVGRWCAAFGIDHHTLNWQGLKPTTGIQAKARVARYDLLAAWCAFNQVTWLLTGHTQDDQAETVVMRQARTNTADSLAGIWGTSKWNDVKILRPILSMRRTDLRTYLNGLDQPWIDDPSNFDETFERVRVRNSLDDARIADLAQIAIEAGQATRALDSQAKDWLHQYLKVMPEGFSTVDKASFCALEEAPQRRVLLQLIQFFGSGTRVDPGELDYISRWVMADGVSRRTLGGAVIACRSDVLIIAREAGRISTVPVLVPDPGEILWDGRFLVSAPPRSHVVPAGVLKDFPRRKDLPNFVQASLAAILPGDGRVVVPHISAEPGISAKFMRCLR